MFILYLGRVFQISRLAKRSVLSEIWSCWTPQFAYLNLQEPQEDSLVSSFFICHASNRLIDFRAVRDELVSLSLLELLSSQVHLCSSSLCSRVVTVQVDFVPAFDCAAMTYDSGLLWCSKSGPRVPCLNRPLNRSSSRASLQVLLQSYLDLIQAALPFLWKSAQNLLFVRAVSPC